MRTYTPLTQALGYYLGKSTMAQELIISLIYLNGKIDPNQEFLVFFLLPIRSPFIVWLYLLLDYANGVSIFASLMLILLTHVFYFLKEIAPKLPFAGLMGGLGTPGIFRMVCDYYRLDDHPFEFPKFD